MKISKLFVILLLGACSLAAQETRGMISGIVTDQQAAVIPGARVTVANTDTNVSTRLTTNATGYYEAPLLTAGTYEVSAEAPGFRRAVRSRLDLRLGQQLQINLELQLGDVAESVTVSGETPILDTSTVTSGKVLTTAELTNLPMMTNTAALFTRLAPGVDVQHQTQYLTAGMTGGGSSFYMPLRIGANEWTLDGAPIAGGTGLAWMPHIDELSEFKIETSNFDASFGHATGLNVSFASKSGTNSLHGIATYQYWNSRWNAAGFFRKQDYHRQVNEAEAAGNSALAQQLRSEPINPPGHSNNWSAAVSGPVYIPKALDGRNRLFFTFSYTGHDDRKPARANEINYTVPTMANRQGDFSDLLPAGASKYQIYDPLTVQADPNRPTHYVRQPFAGNIIPKSRTINFLYDKYNSWMPAPNQPRALTQDPEENFLAFGMTNNNNYKSFNSKIDAVASDKHRLFFRWTWSKFFEEARDWTYDTNPGLHNWDQFRRNKAAVVDWTWAKSAATVVNVNVAANQFRSRSEHYKMTEYKPSDVGFPAYMDAKCAEVGNCVLPRMMWDGYDEMIWPVEADPVVRSQSLKASLMQIRGSHSLSAGIDFRQHYRNEKGGYGMASGNFVFGNEFTRRYDDTLQPAANLGHSWAAFMLGLPSTMEIDTISGYALMSPFYGSYVQDKWRVTRNLTLTLGLRVEFEQGPTERNDHALTYFDPNATLPISQAAQAAYARNPLAELPPSSFAVKGGPVYAGANGVSRRFWDSELMWLPRLSAAWQFHPKMVLRGGYGIYVDSINVMREGVNTYGYSSSTSTTLSNDFGSTWLVGDPGNGVSPLKDPFPVRSDGTRFDVPFGNALGSSAYLGRGLSYQPFGRKHPRVQRWRMGVQRQLGANMVMEAAYWGQFGDHLDINENQRALPGQYWATGMVRNNAIASDLNSNVANPFYIGNFESLKTSDPLLYQQMSTLSHFTSPTIRKNMLLRPNPHMTGLTGRQYIGKGRSHSLEINFQRRMSQGLALTASYSRGFGESWRTIVNEFDPEPRYWLPEQTPISHRFVATAIYDFPFGQGRKYLASGILSHIVGGFQTGITYEFKPGEFVSWGNYFYYGDFNSLPSDLTAASKTLEQWFATGLPFEKSTSRNPAAYHVRVFPLDITSVRRDGINQWSANLRRDFRLREGVTMEIRLDALNLQNRSQFEPPNTNPTSSNFGRITAQTSGVNRFYQLQGRIRF